MKEHVDISALQERHLDLMIRLSFDMDDADEVQRLMDSPDPVLTPEEQAMAQEIFATAQTKAKHHSRTEKRKKPRQTAGHIAMRVIEAAACLILIAMIAVPVAMAASPTFRARVMKLLIEMNPDTQEVQYTFVEDPDASFFVPELWQGDYYPSHIPERFVLQNYDPSFAEAEYQCGIAKFYFSEETDSANLLVSHEGEVGYEEDINGCPAIIFEGGSGSSAYCHILWSKDDRWFSLSSYALDREEAFRIARSVRRTGLEHPVFTPDKDAALAPPYGWLGTHYPTWIPDGWYASSFQIPGSNIFFSNGVEELWFVNDTGMGCTLGTFVAAQVVDLNGHTAWLYEPDDVQAADQDRVLIWVCGDRTLWLRCAALRAEELFAIARSVVPLDGSNCHQDAAHGQPVWNNTPFSEADTLGTKWPYSHIPTAIPEDYYYIGWIWGSDGEEYGFWDGIQRCVFYAEVDAPTESTLNCYTPVILGDKTGWLLTENNFDGKSTTRLEILWEGESCWHRLRTLHFTEAETIDLACSVQPFDPTKGGEVQ